MQAAPSVQSTCALGATSVPFLEAVYGLVLGQNERLWAASWQLGRVKCRGAMVSGAEQGEGSREHENTAAPEQAGGSNERKK